MNLLPLLPLEVAAPKLDYVALSPLIVVFVAAILGVIVEAAMKKHGERHIPQLVIAVLGLGWAAVLTGLHWNRTDYGVHALGSLTIDAPAYFTWMILLVFSLGAVLLISERVQHDGQTAFAPMAAAVPGSPLELKAAEVNARHTEVYPLTLFAVFGMMLFASANDLLTLFVALEVFSLPLYLLCGLARRRRLLSMEAALKYFLLGSLSSAFFLYGTALLYGFTGSFRLSDIDTRILAQGGSSWLLTAGVVMVVVGLLFKIGVVPFHSWTPDVYTGAPTPITAFMAIATKAAAVIALLRFLFVALGSLAWEWQPLIAVLAVLTMLIGSTIALTQSDIKRLLAYSSVAHAGFLLVAIAGAQAGGASTSTTTVGSVLFYLAAYGFATLGAFGIVTMVRKAGGESTSLASWAGLGRKNPVVAALFTLFLLSFAGIPLTGGFVGKLLVFMAAWSGGYEWLVLVAVLLSVVAAFFYLRVIVVMFFREPGEAAEGVTVAKSGIGTWVVVILAAVGTLVLGLWSGPLTQLAQQASIFLR